VYQSNPMYSKTCGYVLSKYMLILSLVNGLWIFRNGRSGVMSSQVPSWILAKPHNPWGSLVMKLFVQPFTVCLLMKKCSCQSLVQYKQSVLVILGRHSIPPDEINTSDPGLSKQQMKWFHKSAWARLLALINWKVVMPVYLIWQCHNTEGHS